MHADWQKVSIEPDWLVLFVILYILLKRIIARFDTDPNKHFTLPLMINI